MRCAPKPQVSRRMLRRDKHNNTSLESSTTPPQIRSICSTAIIALQHHHHTDQKPQNNAKNRSQTRTEQHRPPIRYRESRLTRRPSSRIHTRKRCLIPLRRTHRMARHASNDRAAWQATHTIQVKDPVRHNSFAILHCLRVVIAATLVPGSDPTCR